MWQEPLKPAPKACVPSGRVGPSLEQLLAGFLMEAKQRMEPDESSCSQQASRGVGTDWQIFVQEQPHVTSVAVAPQAAVTYLRQC